jgi:hypothetical protein
MEAGIPPGIDAHGEATVFLEDFLGRNEWAEENNSNREKDGPTQFTLSRASPAPV